MADSNKWAVVEIATKQYFVKENQSLDVNKLAQSEGEIIFDKVLVTAEADNVKVGMPYLAGAKVKAQVLDNYKGPKVLAYKWRRRKKARKLRGHRQLYTTLKISGITV